jgi:prolyl oligopeptidase
VDTYFGRRVVDPYRWLENPDSPETQAWVEAQIALAAGFLQKCPGRELILLCLEQRLDFENRTLAYKRGGRTFFSKHRALENHSIYVCVEENGAERILFDPNLLSPDGTVSLDANSFSISPDGNYLAYGISVAGSDWVEMHVRDITTGEDLTDCLRWTKFSTPRWSVDSKGFFYCRFDEPTSLQSVPAFHKCFYHKVGEGQVDDQLAFENNDEASRNWYYFPSVSSDGRYLLIPVKSTFAGPNGLYLRDLETGELTRLFDEGIARWEYVHNLGSQFWFLTDFEAPRGRLVSVDVSASTGGHLDLREVIPQSKDKRTVLKSVTLTGESFFATYSVNVQSVVREFHLDGRFLRTVKHPQGGLIQWVGGGPNEREACYTFQNYATPETHYRYNIDTGESTLVFRPNVAIDESNYVTRLVFATTAAGMEVPMFITYRKGLKRNGKNASLKYGYGGFNQSLSPNFSAQRTVWLDMGSIYVDAILPGGGEFGEEWHQAGARFNKQAVFDAFVACSQWLIDNRYTSAQKNAIRGGSNGGLLIGACWNQRPELFGAGLAVVSVLDMLRYDQFTAGPYWRGEYGSATASREQYENLLAYSPLHNIVPGVTYPATMVETADHDDRVVPAHSYKYVAALQAAQFGANPIIARIERQAGHCAGTPLTKQLATVADEYAFLVESLKIPSRKLRRLRQIAARKGGGPKQRGLKKRERAQPVGGKVEQQVPDYKTLIPQVYSDSEVMALCAEGDRKRASQTYHDLTHFILVRDVAISLASSIDALIPGMLTQHVREVIIPIAAFLHDIGGGIDPDDHARVGAQWARKYLKKLGFARDDIREISRAIACHRSEVVLKPRSFSRKNFADAAWAIVVIADKAVGDEERVRPGPAAELARLREDRKMSEWTGTEHVQVNFAIKSADLVLDGRSKGATDPGFIVLKLRLDEEVASPEQVCKLYGRRFHACGKAAQYLGFVFRLEFNGERYFYDKKSQEWKRVETIHATMPEEPTARLTGPTQGEPQ